MTCVCITVRTNTLQQHHNIIQHHHHRRMSTFLPTDRLDYHSQRKQSNDILEEDPSICDAQPYELDGQEKGQYYGLAIGFTVIAGAYGGGPRRCKSWGSPKSRPNRRWRADGGGRLGWGCHVSVVSQAGICGTLCTCCC